MCYYLMTPVLPGIQLIVTHLCQVRWGREKDAEKERKSNERVVIEEREKKRVGRDG